MKKQKVTKQYNSFSLLWVEVSKPTNKVLNMLGYKIQPACKHRTLDNRQVNGYIVKESDVPVIKAKLNKQFTWVDLIWGLKP